MKIKTLFLSLLFLGIGCVHVKDRVEPLQGEQQAIQTINQNLLEELSQANQRLTDRTKQRDLAIRCAKIYRLSLKKKTSKSKELQAGRKICEEAGL